MKLLIVVIVALTLSCTAFMGCGDKPVQTPAGITFVAAPAASASTTSVPATDSATVQADALAPPQDAALAPGQIACGKATCEVGIEECCPAKGACEPVGQMWPCGGGNAYGCDSRDDCGGGQLCCWVFGDPAAGTVCMTAPCPETEACHGSSACAAGFACKALATPNDPGTCVFTAPETRCGKTTCAGAKPVCRWNSTKKTSVCVDGKETDPSDDERDVNCSSNADCGGEHCCFWDGRTWCGACGNNYLACKTQADCLPQLGGGQKLLGCVAAGRPDWPPWLKLCEYSEP